MVASMLLGSLLIPKIVSAMQKRNVKKREKIRLTKYTEYLDGINKQIKETMAKQATIMRTTNLNINECLNLLNTNSYWNREIEENTNQLYILELRLQLLLQKNISQ